MTDNRMTSAYWRVWMRAISGVAFVVILWAASTYGLGVAVLMVLLFGLGMTVIACSVLETRAKESEAKHGDE